MSASAEICGSPNINLSIEKTRSAAAELGVKEPTICIAPPARRPGGHSERHAYWRGNEPARQGGLVGWQGLLEAEMTEKFVGNLPV
ncbi:MAG: hypothetical protein ACPIOQ_45275 [Promethearchaeia archaeon]